MENDRTEKYVTELDKSGMHEASQQRLETPGNEFCILQRQRPENKTAFLESIDDLVKRDKEREKDGFPRKIRWRKMLVGAGKVVTVPYVEEGKLVHGQREPKNMENFSAYGVNPNEPDIDETPGSGDGDVGDVIGHAPIGDGHGDGDDGDGDDEGPPGPRAGDQSGDHFEEDAYELGKQLTERLQLPNLKEKMKKLRSEEYTYDLLDRHRGSGQVLDKPATKWRILKTNLALGRISKDHLDPSKMIVGPQDRVYRVLSRERVWKSQAMVFFARDYSGSMWGDPTRALVSQHLMIYSWLLVQYEKRVIPRFYVHDTKAQEVTAQQYFTMNAWGGTYIPSVYQEISATIEGEGLSEKYNLYFFQGSDGDDGDDGEVAIPEIRKMLSYVNRMGVTLFKHPYYQQQNIKTIFEEYVERGEILARRDVFRMHVMSPWGVTEEMNLQALKALIAQD